VETVLEKLKLGINGMEIFGARTAEPLQTCIDEVKKSQIFIGIIGMRYGSVDNDSGKSFVQIEYDTAKSTGLEILIYIIDEQNALIHPAFVDRNEDAKKLQAFKEYLRNTHTVETFTNPDELASKIERDIVRLIRDKGIVIDEDRFEPLSDNKKTIELIDKFSLMPKKLNGSEIELIIEFTSSPYPVDKRTCNALKLTYGASINRRIKIIEPNDNSFKRLDFLKNLYADDDLCDFLYSAETGKHYKIIGKLSFGYVQDFHQASPRISMGWGDKSPHIVNLETGEKIESYIRAIPIEALILVKPL
jgi:hypothetical protein